MPKMKLKKKNCIYAFWRRIFIRVVHENVLFAVDTETFSAFKEQAERNDFLVE